MPVRLTPAARAEVARLKRNLTSAYQRRRIYDLYHEGNNQTIARWEAEMAALQGESSQSAKAAEPEQMREIRLAHGRVDDVAITGVDTFRLEDLGDNGWWIAAYEGNKVTMFYLTLDRKRKEIVATVGCDEIGCTVVEQEPGERKEV